VRSQINSEASESFDNHPIAVEKASQKSQEVMNKRKCRNGEGERVVIFPMLTVS
jgi:hypothetical protein